MHNWLNSKLYTYIIHLKNSSKIDGFKEKKVELFQIRGVSH